MGLGVIVSSSGRGMLGCEGDARVGGSYEGRSSEGV